jgi:adenylate cyclase
MERRLAAIVCADVAGYSRMMGADEAGTHAAFKAHRSAIYPIILNHGGRLVKNTGDGFLLEFPSIVGAIESAIAMQALMAEPPPRGSGHAIPHGHPHGRRDRRRRRSIRG